MAQTSYNLSSLFNHISTKDRAFFIRQMALLVQSGVPLAQAMNLVAQQTDNETLRHAIRVMTLDVESGHPFSQAAARYPQIFDDVMIAMVKSGEASGQLNKVLTQLADQIDTQIAFNSKIRNALIYPIFVLVVLFVVGIIMATVIIPKLEDVFQATNVNLPWTTQAVLGVSNFIINYWYILLIVLVLIVFIGRYLLSGAAGREVLYSLQNRIPVIRVLIINSYLVRFSTVLAMLIRAGVPIGESLGIVGESLGNSLWTNALSVVRQEVERGVPLSAALSRHPQFPKPLTEMIAVGEETGQLDVTLLNMAAFYEQQADSSIKAITSLLEPTLLLIVAVGVGILVVSVILPIYNLAGQL